MKRTLWIHPGIQRTGTTSVQDFLHGNFQALQKRGILYPYNTRRHFSLMNRILGGETSVDTVAADLIARANAKPAPVHAIVLSDEAISLRRDLSVLAGFRKHFDVRIILFLRRQDLWLESWYFQNVKWQWNPDLSHCTLEAFLTQRKTFHWLDYDRYVSHLEKLFGAENVELVVFESAEMDGGPVHEFCRRVGIGEVSGLDQPGHSNASLSPAMSEFIRHLPVGEGLGDSTRQALVQACEAADAALPARLAGGGKLILPHDTRRAVTRAYETGNTRLARRRFGRDQLFRAPLPAETEPVADLALPRDSAELMQHFVVPVLRGLIHQGAVQNPQKKGRRKNG
jgi:hypothetical protein